MRTGMESTLWILRVKITMKSDFCMWEQQQEGILVMTVALNLLYFKLMANPFLEFLLKQLYKMYVPWPVELAQEVGFCSWTCQVSMFCFCFLEPTKVMLLMVLFLCFFLWSFGSFFFLRTHCYFEVIPRFFLL